MAKGQKRNNREQKKPKQDKAKTAPAASPFVSDMMKKSSQIGMGKRKP